MSQNQQLPKRCKLTLHLNYSMKAGSWPKVVKPRLSETVKYLKSQGVSSIGVMGFCWGSKQCMNVLGDASFPEVKGAALFHPSMLENSDAEKSLRPCAVFPSKDEPDLRFVKRLVAWFSRVG